MGENKKRRTSGNFEGKGDEERKIQEGKQKKGERKKRKNVENEKDMKGRKRLKCGK